MRVEGRSSIVGSIREVKSMKKSAKLTAESNRLYAEADKLRAEGNRLTVWR